MSAAENLPDDSPRSSASSSSPKTKADRVLAVLRTMPIRRGPSGLVLLAGDRVVPIPSPDFEDEVQAAWLDLHPDETLAPTAITRALVSLRADKTIAETDRRPPPPKPRLEPVDPRARLRAHLADESGDVRDTLANVLSIFSLDSEWRGVIAYNEFSEAPVILKSPPQRRQDAVTRAPGSDWTEQDSTRAATWISEAYGADPSSKTVTEAMMAVAQRRLVHPPREYIDGLPAWDGTKRIESFFSTYCGTPDRDREYAAGVARVLFLSAVARIRKPGCKVDTIVILESKQGGLKSSLVAALFSPWSSDTPLPLGDKDAYQQLRGVWGYELAELASFKGRDATRIKSFASSAADNYRPSFERRSRAVPRQCIMIGTTNEDQYLDDATGARRFPPVKVPAIDVDAVRRDRDLLWAEADARLKAGEPYWPTKELDRQITTETEARYVGDPWEEPIRTWLERPAIVRIVDGHADEERLDTALGLTMSQVLEGAVGVQVARQGKPEQERAQKILRRAGWIRGAQHREDGKLVRRWYRGPGDTPGDTPGDSEKQP